MIQTKYDRVDKAAPEEVTTEVLLGELKTRILLFEHSRKTHVEAAETFKAKNLERVQKERRLNKIRSKFMVPESIASAVNMPDQANIAAAFGDQRERPENLALTTRKLQEVVDATADTVCDSSKALNLLRYQHQLKELALSEADEQLTLLQREEEKMLLEDTGPVAQRKRQLENSIEKMKLKLCSAKKISRYYQAIQKLLVDESVMHSARLDFLEHAVAEHRNMLEEVKEQRADSFAMTEATIKDLKNAHACFVENKRAREANISNTRRDAERANTGLKSCLKVTLARHADINDPHKDSIVPPQVSASKMEIEEERNRRLEAETQVSHLRRVCKVTAKEDVLPALRMQTNVEASLEHQIELLEKEKAALQRRLNECVKEYKQLKYYGDRDLVEASMKLKDEKSVITKNESGLSVECATALKNKTLLCDIEKAVGNLQHILKISNEVHEEETASLVEQIKACSTALKDLYESPSMDQNIEILKDSTELADHLLEILPSFNRRISRRKDEEDDQYVFDDDGTKNVVSVPSRHAIKLQSQQILDKNAGRGGRTKAKTRKA